jgi:hypothetical protein
MGEVTGEKSGNFYAVQFTGGFDGKKKTGWFSEGELSPWKDSDKKPDLAGSHGEVSGHTVGTLAGYKKTSGSLGSNPGGEFTSPTGVDYYVKAPKTDDHVRNEVLANDLYRVAGVGVPDVDMVHLNGEIDGKHGLGVRSKVVESTSLQNNVNDPKHMSAARRDLAVHAWLGNWDAVGPDNTNLRFDNDGKPTVIDSGGSLLYRAQGEEKGQAFGDKVTELDTLRDPAKNPTAAAVFGATTDDELRNGAERVQAITPEQIDQMVSNAGFSGTKAKKLSDTLKARREDVIKQVFGGKNDAGGGDGENNLTMSDIKLAPDGTVIGPDGNPIGSIVYQGNGEYLIHDSEGEQITTAVDTGVSAFDVLLAHYNKNNNASDAQTSPKPKIGMDDIDQAASTSGPVYLHSGEHIGNVIYLGVANGGYSVVDAKGNEIAKENYKTNAWQKLFDHYNSSDAPKTPGATSSSGSPVNLSSKVFLNKHPNKLMKENVLLADTGGKIGSVSSNPDGTFVAHDVKNNTISSHGSKNEAANAVLTHHESTVFAGTSSGGSGGGSGGNKEKHIPEDALTGSLAYDHPVKIPDSDLPPGAKHAILHYTGSGYHEINSYLRTSKGEDGELLTEKEEHDIISKIRALNEIFDAVPPITKGVVVKRGVSAGHKMFGNIGTAIGKVFRDNGFTSTSTNKEFHGDTTVRIHLPAGTKVLRVGDYGGSFGHSESEFLLPAGSRYRILSDVKDDYKRRLELELIL